MQFSVVTVIAALALDASAEPIPLTSRDTISGSNPGSIFQFGDTNACRDLFWQDGACGLSTYFNNGQVDPNMPLVAIPGSIFSQYGNWQNNRLCAKTITMHYNGVTQKAIIADQNVGGDNSVDMCLDMWQAFGGRDGDGSILRGMTWSIDF